MKTHTTTLQSLTQSLALQAFDAEAITPALLRKICDGAVTPENWIEAGQLQCLVGGGRRPWATLTDDQQAKNRVVMELRDGILGRLKEQKEQNLGRTTLERVKEAVGRFGPNRKSDAADDALLTARDLWKMGSIDDKFYRAVRDAVVSGTVTSELCDRVDRNATKTAGLIGLLRPLQELAR